MILEIILTLNFSINYDDAAAADDEKADGLRASTE